MSFVQCSTYPAKGYSLVMRIKDETATVYKLQPFDGSRSGSSKPASTKNLRVSNVEFAPGIISKCSACGSDNRFICTCGTNSCIADNANLIHVRPANRSTTSFGSASHINASQSSGSNKSDGGKPSLPKGSGLFLGSKK